MMPRTLGQFFHQVWCLGLQPAARVDKHQFGGLGLGGPVASNTTAAVALALGLRSPARRCALPRP